MKKLFILSSWVLTVALVPVYTEAQQYNFLDPLPFFGPHDDGSLRPGDKPYVTATSFQRGLAYSPSSGYLVFIDRAAGSAGSAAISGAIYVLNLSGDEVHTLSTN